MQESTVFYHYTSISSLFQIIKNKSLLLSSVESLNDVEEASYSIDDFERDFKSLCESKSNDELIPFLYNEVFLPKSKEFRELASAEINPFVFSLSRNKDNLAHWERYGDYRKGVCIGFDISKLKQMPFVSYGFVQINPIKYKVGETIEYLYEELLSRFQKQSIVNLPPEQKRQFAKDMGYVFISDIYRQMKYFIKKEVWKDEGEIRIAYEDRLTQETLSQVPYLKEKYPNAQFPDYKKYYNDTGLDELKFLLINNKIRSCRFLNISSVWGRGIITEVMLGPKCEQNKKELELFLNDNGLLGIGTTESKIKIR